jgi:heat induced stress protein YflT
MTSTTTPTAEPVAPAPTMDTVLAVYRTQAEAEAAVKKLEHASFDMRKLSIVGRDYHTEQDVLGYYNTGDRVRFWGKWGGFWGGLAGLLLGSAFLVIPLVGHVIVLGPLVSWIANGVAGAVVGGGLSAFGAALYSLGIPKDSILAYETALKADRFLLIAHGTTPEVEQARAILATTAPERLDVHRPAGSEHDAR